MFDSAILDTAIGVIFVLILFSTVCAAVRESIESILKTRASYLEYGIRELLADKGAGGLVEKLYNHPLVAGLFAGDYRPPTSGTRSVSDWKRRNLPSYIPARNFATALIDLAARGQVGAPPRSGGGGKIDLDAIRKTVSTLQNKKVERVLLNAIDLAEGDINQAVANLAAWFDSGMDRVSGWYKRLSSRIIFVLALVLALILNIDLLRISRELYGNDEQRAMLVAYAQSSVADPAFVEKRQQAFQHLQDKEFPVGWDQAQLDRLARVTGQTGDYAPGTFVDMLVWLVGFLFTAFAATLGAPFWFDVLNKVMVIRATVKPHEKSREERSQDNH